MNFKTSILLAICITLFFAAIAIEAPAIAASLFFIMIYLALNLKRIPIERH